MNYEKAYKEALKRARKYKEKGYMMINAALDNIFPELKDSEDEMIKKALIRNFTNQHSSNFPTADGFTREQILAWLEKQGEQKPSWSEEDETNLTNTIIMLKEGASLHFTNSSITSCVDWLKSLKNRVQPQPKQEWSEYDKIQLSEAIQMIEANGTWVRSEDSVKKVSNWLKSIRPQNKWKPSEEQLNAFEHFIRSIGKSGYASPYNNNTKLIYSLLNDLKNL